MKPRLNHQWPNVQGLTHVISLYMMAVRAAAAVDAESEFPLARILSSGKVAGLGSVTVSLVKENAGNRTQCSVTSIPQETLLVCRTIAPLEESAIAGGGRADALADLIAAMQSLNIVMWPAPVGCRVKIPGSPIPT